MIFSNTANVWNMQKSILAGWSWNTEQMMQRDESLWQRRPFVSPNGLSLVSYFTMCDKHQSKSVMCICAFVHWHFLHTFFYCIRLSNPILSSIWSAQHTNAHLHPPEMTITDIISQLMQAVTLKWYAWIINVLIHWSFKFYMQSTLKFNMHWSIYIISRIKQ